MNGLPPPLPPRLGVPLALAFGGAIAAGAVVGGIVGGFTFLPLFIGGCAGGAPAWLGEVAYIPIPGQLAETVSDTPQTLLPTAAFDGLSDLLQWADVGREVSQ